MCESKAGNLKPFENKIWLSSPTMHGDELKYMKEAYDTNWMSTVGANIDAIEDAMCERIGCGHAVALSSGTAALHLAVKVCGEELYGKPKPGHGSIEGRRVFCSDMTFVATVNPVVYEGGIPVFIDSEYDTWNMDPAALERAFEKYPDVKIVILAHLYGTPAKICEIKSICKRYNALLIEDAAESLGASYKGKQTGSLGDVACISFNGNKIITGSSGGMLLTDNEDWAEKVKKWSTQAREPVSWYEHKEIGYNYRMSNVIAGIVRGQIPYLEEHIGKKKKIYERYKAGFKDIPVSMNPVVDVEGTKPNYWLSCMLIEKGCHVKPKQVLEAIAALNAEGRPIWKPMHMQPVYHGFNFIPTSKNNDRGTDIYSQGLCLPSDLNMEGHIQDKVIEAVKGCFNDVSYSQKRERVV